MAQNGTDVRGSRHSSLPPAMSVILTVGASLALWATMYRLAEWGGLL